MMKVGISHKKEAYADEIAEMVRRIAERFDPDQIILFGSRARGTARPNSDVDLLVVMPIAGSKRETQIAIRCALHDIHVAKDIIVATPDEVEKRRNIIGTIIRPALREGKFCMPEADERLCVARQWMQKAENDLKTAEYTLQ